MEGGDPGLAGHPALSHVVQGPKLDQEGVIIHLQLMVGDLVRGQALQQRNVTHVVVQV